MNSFSFPSLTSAPLSSSTTFDTDDISRWEWEDGDFVFDEEINLHYNHNELIDEEISNTTSLLSSGTFSSPASASFHHNHDQSSTLNEACERIEILEEIVSSTILLKNQTSLCPSCASDLCLLTERKYKEAQEQTRSYILALHSINSSSSLSSSSIMMSLLSKQQERSELEDYVRHIKEECKECQSLLCTTYDERRENLAQINQELDSISKLTFNSVGLSDEIKSLIHLGNSTSHEEKVLLDFLKNNNLPKCLSRLSQL